MNKIIELAHHMSQILEQLTPEDVISKTMTLVSFPDGRCMLVDGEQVRYAEHANVLTFTIYPKRGGADD